MIALRRLASLWRTVPPPVAAMLQPDASKELCESSYPYKVDVRVPPEGLGRKVDDMVLWCDEHSSGAWDSFDHRTGDLTYLRFYFLEESAAEAFVAAWEGQRRA